MSEEDLKTSIYEDDGNAPAGWVHGDPDKEDVQDLLDHIAVDLSTEVGFLELGFSQDKMNLFSNSGEWEWELGQKEYIGCDTWFIANKCRQFGGSLALAAKKCIRGILSPTNYNAILTSYKKEEAIGKIDYVRMFLDALPPRFRKKIIRDPHHLIEFQNANGTRVKIISHAQKPIRGINGDIGLDELAFYTIAYDIYASALPAVAQVNGDIDVISTPFGKSGLYFEIFSDKNKYPEFTRLPIMWWHAKRYLKLPTDEYQIKAILEAPNMTTEERVRVFGNSSINRQFDNSDLETFRQEFEGFFVDEQAAFFSKDLILSCVYGADVSHVDEYSPEDDDYDIDIEKALAVHSSLIEKKYAGKIDVGNRPIHFRKYNSIQDLMFAVQRGEISPKLIGGADVGTTRHSAHFVILEEVVLPDGTTLQIERYSENRLDWKLQDQTEYYRNLLNYGIITHLGMDTTGLGTHMGQVLKKEFQNRFTGFAFSGASLKQDHIMTNLKNRMTSLGIAIYNDKLTIESIYSINRIISPTKSISYKADEKKRHHADAAWAFGIASYIGTPADTTIPSAWNPLKVADTVNQLQDRPDLRANKSSNYGGDFSRLNLDSSLRRQQVPNFINPGNFIKNYDG